jgi:hypothetical protein
VVSLAVVSVVVVVGSGVAVVVAGGGCRGAGAGFRGLGGGAGVAAGGEPGRAAARRAWADHRATNSSEERATAQIESWRVASSRLASASRDRIIGELVGVGGHAVGGGEEGGEVVGEHREAGQHARRAAHRQHGGDPHGDLARRSR